MTEVEQEQVELRPNGEAPQEEAAAGRLKIDGKVYEMPRDFKLDELEIIERYTGQYLGDVEWVSVAAFKAVALIIKQREDPDFPEDQVGQLSVQWEDVEEEGAEKADPPSPSPAASGAQT